MTTSASPVSAGTISDLWLGGTGSWSNPAGWSAGVPQNGGGNTYNVSIASGGADLVSLDTSPSLGSLTLGGASGSATLRSGQAAQTLQLGSLTVNQTGSLSLLQGGAVGVTGNVSNAGSITLYNGNTLTAGGSLTNSGSFIASDSVNLAGALNNLAGGYVQVNAGANASSLANAGSLTIAVGSSLNLTGGGLGMTDVVGGSSLTVSGSFNVINGGVAGYALANLGSVEGSLFLNNGLTTSLSSLNNSGAITLYRDSGLSVSGDIAGSGSLTAYGNLNVSGSYVIRNAGSLLIGGTANLNTLSNSGQVAITAGGTLNVTGGGPGVTDIAAGVGYSVDGGFYVINSGVADSALAGLRSVEGSLALGAGQSLSLAALSNSGSISLYSGSALATQGDLTNSGTMFTTGDLTVNGTLRNTTGGMIQINSTADVAALANAGDVAVAAGGVLNLTGGGPGITDIAAGTSYTVSGSFNVIDSGVATSALASLATVEGTLLLNNGDGNTFAGLTNTGDVTVNSASGLTVLGDLTSSSSLSDYGSLTVAGVLRNLAGGNFVAHGVTSAANFVNGGLTTVGMYNDLEIGANAEPEHGYTQSLTGSLTEMIYGDGSFGVIDAYGGVSLNGVLNIQLANGFIPQAGQTFSILNFAPGTLTGTFSSIQNGIFNNGTEQFLVTYDNAAGQVLLTAELLTGSGDLPAVPEPSSALVLALGLPAAAWVTRRHKLSRRKL